MQKNANPKRSNSDKKRSALVAMLLGFLAPGLGFLYAGMGRVAIITPIFLFALLLAFSWAGVLLSPSGFWFVVGSVSVLSIFLLIVACRYASRASIKPVHWYQRWYVYLLFIGVSHLSLSISRDFRGTIIGIETHSIPSNSMASTLQPGDFILSNSRAYRSANPKVGDIVIFDYPPDPKQVYIKRIIGLPGDRVEIIGGVVYVSGEKLDEPYVSDENNVRSARQGITQVVPNQHYFVLGDNRDNSSDSRMWGFVPAEGIRGRLSHIWLSFGDNGLRSERIGSMQGR